MLRRAWPIAAYLCLLSLAGCGGDNPSDEDGGVTLPDAALPMDEPCSTPGALETVPCGACGTVQRFCAASGRWEYGVCSSETGACLPGSTRSAECGSCGTRREVCTSACAWEGMSECTGEGECTAGELVFTRDGCERGQREVRCNDSCVFEDVGECTFEACASPGALETVSCGMCGERDRFCTAGGEWEYGACEGQGGCTPGTSEEQACGACGTQTVRCNDRCEWVASGECAGEGECVPGTIQSRADGCSDGQTRPYTCSGTCEYAPSGECSGGTTGGTLGQACTPGSCASGLVCSSGTGVSVCRTPCTTSDVCGLSGHCFTADMVCADGCTVFTNAGCPSGAKCDFMGYPDGTLSLLPITVCSGTGTGTRGSSCTLNSQCASGFTCRTNETGTSGTCTQVCDSSHPCPSDQTCDAGGGGLPFPPLGDTGYCG